jgi:hypothetical protein
MWRFQEPLKRRRISTRLHDARSQNTVAIWNHKFSGKSLCALKDIAFFFLLLWGH